MPGFDGTGPRGSGPRGGGRCRWSSGCENNRGAALGRVFFCRFLESVVDLTLQEKIESLKLCKKNLEEEIEFLEKEAQQKNG